MNQNESNMNLLNPVSSIMSEQLLMVAPEDNLEAVKDIFDKRQIHHIPVVHCQEIVGMISKSDFLPFLRGQVGNHPDQKFESRVMENWRAKDIMTKGLAKVEADDSLRTVLEVFKLNLFHALPVVDGDKLVGIVTTHDIISAMAAEPVTLADYQAAKTV